MAHVVVIDDSLDTRHLMSRVLAMFGHRVESFGGGKEALAVMDQPEGDLPDLILLDYMMPGMNGLEVLRELQSDPRTLGIPVILFTANDDDQLKEQALVEGASDFWVKAAFGINTMQQRIEDLLKSDGTDPSLTSPQAVLHVSSN
jgi:CheY-like chemotaxis protein